MTTDFGAPDVAPARDALPLEEPELRRQTALLRACWQAFDAAVSAASGQELRRGPRGGGRDLDAMVLHVLNSEAAYLSRIGAKWTAPPGTEADPSRALRELRPEAGRFALAALAASARGEVPAVGPRGGARWPARYFVRRAAWHVLDHAWEIEDRLEGATTSP
jgi:hypothetical protein